MYETDKWSEYQGYDPNGESIEDIVKRMTVQQKMIASTIQEIKQVGDDVQYNRSQITQTADMIRQEVNQKIEGIEGAWEGEYSSLVEQTAQEIRAELDAKISDYDTGITQRYRSEILQTATSIRQEVSTIEQTLDGRINVTNSRITQTSNEIRSEVTNLGNVLDAKINANHSSIVQRADSITTTVEGIITNVDNIASRLSTAEIKITDSSIVSTVRQSTSYKDDLAAKANTSTVNNLGARLLSAESEIESKFTEAKTYAETKSSEAYVASEAYALAKSDLARIKAEAYADGIVTAEEQARIDQAVANLAEAKAHAEAKAKEAENASKAYAETEFIIDRQRMSVIEQNAESITTMVGSHTTLIGFLQNTEIPALKERLNTAEIRVTDSSIISTVRSSTAYWNDLGQKVNESELYSKIEQTVSTITIQANQINLDGITRVNQRLHLGGTYSVGGAVKGIFFSDGSRIIQESGVDGIRISAPQIILETTTYLGSHGANNLLATKGELANLVAKFG